MVDTKMFIPKTITVGYNKRDDTYTGKLAYVIYTDDKGKLRKETSWQSWRQTNLGRDDFDNVPTTGFVLNKGVGGVRMSYGWNTRNEYIRVYDPRNFEFEISVSNLLFILQECSSIKGKGLEGEFVYSWSGTELVLLPVDCEEYKECVKHTARQKVKIDKKDIKEGFSYIRKDGTNVMYLGRHNYNDADRYYYDKKCFCPVGKRHVFLILDEGYKKDDWRTHGPYITDTGFTKIAECTSSESLPEFANEYEKFKKSAYCGDLKSVKLKKIKLSDGIMNHKALLIKEDDKFYVCEISTNYNYDYGYYSKRKASYNIRKSKKPFEPELKDNSIEFPAIIKQTSDIDAISVEDIEKKDFYILNVQTEQGKLLEVIR